MELDTWCPNCKRETLHDHEHGPEDGRRKCVVRCRSCGEESGIASVYGNPPAHDVHESLRWPQAEPVPA